jgi:hypothetical protein
LNYKFGLGEGEGNLRMHRGGVGMLMVHIIDTYRIKNFEENKHFKIQFFIQPLKTTPHHFHFPSSSDYILIIYWGSMDGIVVGVLVFYHCVTQV